MAEQERLEEPIDASGEAVTEGREQILQRRVLRLLFQHDVTLLRQQFQLFSANSTLPALPLLQQYDRLLKVRMLSDELLNDILPRIRRELSLETNQRRLREESPTRGDIDWTRTLERAAQQQPGLPPLQFETRLRQRTLATPANTLVVAILLALRQELQQTLTTQFVDEDLSAQERQAVASIDEQAERELAAPYARALSEQQRGVAGGNGHEPVAAARRDRALTRRQQRIIGARERNSVDQNQRQGRAWHVDALP